MATKQELVEELAEVCSRLEEAEETLQAIRHGEVDALVISGSEGDRVFTLKGADHTYRVLVESINEGAVTVAANDDIFYANQRLAEILGTPLERLIGTPIRSYVEAADQELFAALLEHGRQGASKGEVSFRNQNGLIVPAYLSFKNVNLAEAPGAVCLVVTDLTEQKRQEAILAEEQLSRAIFEQAEAVIVVVNPEGHIIRASHEAHQICRGNLLLRKFDEVFQLETFDTSGKKSNPAAYGPFSVSFTLQGKIFHGLEVRFYPPEGREPLEMLLNAGPLRGSQGEVLGAVVAMTDITARKRAEAEREMLLADIQVQAEELQVNNEELISQTEELAVQAEELSTQAENLRALSSRLAEVEELERQRLARELHDQVCQNLAIINISLATLTIKAHREPLDKLLSRLADVGALAEQTGEITREIMEGLRPTALDHYGLIGGLHHLGNQFSAQTGIAVNVEGKESARRFAAPVELALFRITQEALANVAKHSRATKVAVCHEEKEDTFYLTIADNGIGFDQDKAVLPTAGCKWGLMNMNERAMAVGGHCQVESHRGKGTRVVVKVRRRALPSS